MKGTVLKMYYILVTVNLSKMITTPMFAIHVKHSHDTFSYKYFYVHIHVISVRLDDITYI